MKVLLVNPKFSGFEFSNHTACIPIGIAYIGSYLKEKGIDVKIIDYLTDSKADSHLAKEIVSSDMVGLSVMTTRYSIH